MTNWTGAIVTGEQVYLRRIAAGDHGLAMRLHEADAGPWLVPRVARSPAEVAVWLTEIDRGPSSMAFTVCRVETHEAIGLLWFWGCDGASASVSFGLADGRGEGIADEVGVLGAHVAFNVLGLRRVTGGCAESNKGSMKLMERLGFQREGRLREATFVRGEWQDNIIFGLLAEEWRARCPKQ